MKAAFFEIEDWEIPYLKDKLPGFDIQFFEEKIEDADIKEVEEIEVISVFIHSKINKEALDKFPKLKAVATRSTGFDHIDTKECSAREIMVCNVPSYGENTVAEHAFALILALSRKLPQCMEATNKGSFTINTQMRGFDLAGKTFGCIGTGKIGRHAIRMAKGFEMKVIASDPFPNEKLPEELGFSYVPLDQLLKESDVISIHVPFNENTKHMINKESISMMKETAIIINTSRGGIIETEALVNVIMNKKIGGAGLDVLEGECDIMEERELLTTDFKKTCESDYKTLLQDHLLMRQENVIVTPHNAFNSKEALLRILDTTVENILSFDSGVCANQVN